MSIDANNVKQTNSEPQSFHLYSLLSAIFTFHQFSRSIELISYETHSTIVVIIIIHSCTPSFPEISTIQRSDSIVLEPFTASANHQDLFVLAAAAAITITAAVAASSSVTAALTTTITTTILLYCSSIVTTTRSVPPAQLDNISVLVRRRRANFYFQQNLRKTSATISQNSFKIARSIQGVFDSSKPKPTRCSLYNTTLNCLNFHQLLTTNHFIAKRNRLRQRSLYMRLLR